jgi:hypothetical protein
MSPWQLFGRRYAMKLNRAFIVTGMLSVFLFAGCASITAGPILEERISEPKRGYVVGAIEAKAGNFETPPYIPTKIKYELTAMLRSGGILAEGAGKEKTLLVYIETSARYIGGASGTVRYSELQSRVILKDACDSCYAAAALIVAYNGYGAVLSDFTERNHAQDILDFIKRVLER